MENAFAIDGHVVAGGEHSGALSREIDSSAMNGGFFP